VVDKPSHAAVLLVPTPTTERIPILDVLRGFAIFGILLVNLNTFTYHRSYEHATGWTLLSKVLNRGAEQFIVQFGSGKFITLFSFLFGLGFALQLVRVEARGLPIVRIYCRRLIVLLAIGLVHAFLIWEGDILVYYASTGFLLLFFRDFKPRTLLACAAFFYLLPLVKWEVTLYQHVRKSSSQVGQSLPSQNGQAKDIAQDEISRRVFRHGSFREIESRRIHDVLFFYSEALQEAPRRLALFLLGLYAGKRQIFRDIRSNAVSFGRLGSIGLVVGLIGNLGNYILYNPALPIWTSLLKPVTAVMGIFGLAACYVSAAVHLIEKEAWRPWLLPIAEVGRAALSNYLLQSLFLVTIFYSYGLGLFERIEPAAGICLTVLIYAFELFVTKWWLKRFRFGPAEWMWRTLTYGAHQPVRL
jgi:uncharacterized protein